MPLVSVWGLVPSIFLKHSQWSCYAPGLETVVPLMKTSSLHRSRTWTWQGKPAAGLILECTNRSAGEGNQCKAPFYLKEVAHEGLLARWLLRSPAPAGPRGHRAGFSTPVPARTPAPAAPGRGPGLASLCSLSAAPLRRQESPDWNKPPWD